MKKILIRAVAAMALTSCSSDALVDNRGAGGTESQTPIAFNVNKRNITRAEATSLESNKHYNFGIWAYKTTDADSVMVMGNYLVGYSDGNGTGYDKSGSTTWSSASGADTDHMSPWFYEKLGTAEYLNEDAAKGYTKNQAEFMSANQNQYLRYWDLAYDNTVFYAYAPYHSKGVTFDITTNTISVAASANTAAYDDPTLHEFIYAATSVKNADLKDVKLQFKHLGAQIKLNFCEDIPGYKVKIIDVTTSGSGIQATPAVKTDDNGTITYTKAKYYTSCGATINMSSVTAPTATTSHGTDAETTDENLKFQIPTGDVEVPAKVSTGEQQYVWSPTVYYAVPQPDGTTTGFTFHVSYQLIAEDNGEVITIHDARVYVPADVVDWKPNTRYLYQFKFTVNSTGTTDPNVNVDVTDPTVPTKSNVYPIVFDGATIEDYTSDEKSI